MRALSQKTTQSTIPHVKNKNGVNVKSTKVAIVLFILFYFLI